VLLVYFCKTLANGVSITMEMQMATYAECEKLVDVLRDESTWKGDGDEWDVLDAATNPDCVCTRCGDSLGCEWTKIWHNMREQCPNWPVMCVGCTEEYFNGTSQIVCAIQRNISWVAMYEKMRRGVE